MGSTSVPVGKYIIAARFALSHSTSTPSASETERNGIIIRPVAGSINGFPAASDERALSEYLLLPSVNIRMLCSNVGAGGGLSGEAAGAILLFAACSPLWVTLLELTYCGRGRGGGGGTAILFEPSEALELVIMAVASPKICDEIVDVALTVIIVPAVTLLGTVNTPVEGFIETPGGVDAPKLQVTLLLLFVGEAVVLNC